MTTPTDTPLSPTTDAAATVATPPPSSNAGIARAALIIGTGNVASRILGLAREVVLTHYFGAGGVVSAYTVASFVPQMLYDLIIGGMVSSALVPVFSDYAERGKKELGRVASDVLTLTLIAMALLASLLILFAPQLAQLLGGDLPPQYLATTVGLLRLMAPATIFLGLSGVTTAILYALRRFTLPAFVVAVYNATLVLTIVLSGGQNIVWAAIGLVLGAIAQVALQWPGLRDLPLRVRIDLHDPALKRIIFLYLPMLLGIAAAQIGAIVDRRLASGVHESAIAWMRYATTLQQFPQGLVSTAVSMAALPALARQINDLPGFRRTLGFALRIVLLLVIPMAVGLFLLATPVVAALFERGKFTPEDTLATARALRLYMVGLPFAAIDLPLVYAFYARGDTLTPNLVAFVGLGAYFAIALTFVDSYGVSALVAANAAQLAAHAVTMVVLAQWRFGAIRGQGLGMLLAKVSLASLAMGVTILGMLALLAPLHLSGFWGALTTLIVAGGAGILAFGVAVAGMRIDEAQTLAALTVGRLRRPG